MPREENLDADIAKLTLRAGDVLLVRLGSGISHESIRAMARNWPKDDPRRGCLILSVRELDDVRVINEAVMKKLGWSKIKTEEGPEEPKDVA